ncbi:hypothetical protein BpOF4_17635 [Alkalihalophilus pseudofirmus OF4]|uniref:Uncharacterized protein n=1 Tax=Alkalihalophilus pseudofirmus (strain ATCC BAA-2126 / JCM 17055 / OF4) TaxID=398511 RepID=D3FRH7_ALKPO|nr:MULTISPECIES: DUF6007 family protein [Alkalihalophilus]ADC51568.1 hypothetical protein BpOF4_17635 [Alkalihalophilus pseudofirmus OF4]MED1603356.1 DUF6007 family protein [Alkalihalophilus marmarensis]
MKHDQEDVIQLFKGITIWEVSLFVPATLLFLYLPADNFFHIIINVVIFFLCVIGIYSIISYLKLVKKKKRNSVT